MLYFNVIMALRTKGLKRETESSYTIHDSRFRLVDPWLSVVEPAVTLDLRSVALWWPVVTVVVTLHLRSVALWWPVVTFVVALRTVQKQQLAQRYNVLLRSNAVIQYMVIMYSCECNFAMTQNTDRFSIHLYCNRTRPCSGLPKHFWHGQMHPPDGLPLNDRNVLLE